MKILILMIIYLSFTCLISCYTFLKLLYCTINEFYLYFYIFIVLIKYNKILFSVILKGNYLFSSNFLHS